MWSDKRGPTVLQYKLIVTDLVCGRVNLSNLSQLGMLVLWWISGVGGLTRFALSTCILIHFLETRME